MSWEGTMETVESSGRKLPVVEVFGPTIQGEGPEAGLPCCFVRLGGCDYRCSWCDSMYAVEPAEVRKAERLTAEEIVERLPAGVPRVILSGGNPALLDLGELVTLLHANERRVSVETQGSRWKEWLCKVDMLIISPKPPSSGMVSFEHEQETRDFIEHVEEEPEFTGAFAEPKAALKIVVFDETDYEWARAFHEKHPALPCFVSAGTPVPSLTDIVASDEDVKREICERYRWLCERVAADPLMSYVRVLPQLHVLAWGTVRGV